MATPRFHVVPHEEGWAIKREGDSKEEAVYSTQKEAIAQVHDKAREEEADVVVHRQDGTFRKVINYTDNANGNGESNVKKSDEDEQLRPRDVFSVGSRISWSAVLAGGCISLATYAALTVGGVAVGLGVSEVVRGDTLAVGAGIWMLVTAFVSLFMGGFVVSRTTAGETKCEALSYGVVLWGFLFVALTLFQALGAAIGVRLIDNPEATPVAKASEPNQEVYEKAGVDAATAKKLDAAFAETARTAKKTNATAMAWWLFASVVLSLGACVLGAFVGAGPKLVFEEMAARRLDLAQQAA